MPRFIAVCLAFAFGLVALPATVSAADLALVIGNSSYRKAPNAESGAADARAVAEALEEGGYEVILGIDSNRRQMERLLSRFGARVGRADRAVIFFSGHALRADGETYLAPTDQDNDTLVEVVMGGVPLDLVLQLARRNAGKTVLFIDAAQLDGFRPTSFAEPGLAHIEPGRGVMVVSAAAPGRAIRRRGGGESRFARQIIRNFLDPGTRVADAARGLRGPIWVNGSTDPRLVLIPHGRSRVGGGGGGPRTLSPAEAEAALGLTIAQRRSVQENLSLLGHDPRGIDGAFGPGTRTAIRLWERANRLPETGYLDTEKYALLNRQAGEGSRPRSSEDDRYWERTGARGTPDGYRDYLSRYSDGSHAAEARAELQRISRTGRDGPSAIERDFWRQTQASDRPRDYREYVRRYPTGIWLPEAEDRLAALEGASSTPPPAPAHPRSAEEDLGLDRTDRLSVEQRLNFLKFPPGTVDGFFDENTRWAIEGYQRSRGFEPTGYLDQPTVVRLMDETGGVDSQPGIVIDGAEVLRRLLGGN
ncbi:MAG TPA: peptidoglycan-binding protein [Thermohalobaculum sp.]|nr:peptidoglycan-binding protein [Thermohalobaculum sp.]